MFVRFRVPGWSNRTRVAVSSTKQYWFTEASVTTPSAKARAGCSRRVDGGGRMGLCAGVGRPRHECFPRIESGTSGLVRAKDVAAAGVRHGSAAPRCCRAPCASAPRAALPALSAALVPARRLFAWLWWLRRTVSAAAAGPKLGVARRRALPGWPASFGVARAPSCAACIPALRARAASSRHALSVDGPRSTAAEKDVQQTVLEYARNRHAPHSGTRRWARVHDSRVLLAELRAKRTTLQSEIQAGESHSSAHRRKTLSLPIPWLRESICQIGKLKNSQKDTYR